MLSHPNGHALSSFADTPVCGTDWEKELGALKHETLRLKYEVHHRCCSSSGKGVQFVRQTNKTQPVRGKLGPAGQQAANYLDYSSYSHDLVQVDIHATSVQSGVSRLKKPLASSCSKERILGDFTVECKIQFNKKTTKFGPSILVRNRLND